METAPQLSGRMSSENEMDVCRKYTEEQPPAGLPSTSTPPRDIESKRRRLTSEAAGGVLLREQEEAGLAVSGLVAAPLPGLPPGTEDRLRELLDKWAKQLVHLQPKVQMSDHLTESGLCLFKYLRHLQEDAAARGLRPRADLASEAHLVHDLVACWWIALKHCSVRTAVPNRTLMARATRADPELLSERELGALLLLDWEVNLALRLSGLIA